VAQRNVLEETTFRWVFWFSKVYLRIFLQSMKLLNTMVQSINTNIKQFSIKCKGALTIRSLNSIKKFKRQIVDSLLQKYENNTGCKNKLCMFFICVMFYVPCVLIIIFYFMCCIRLCSNCFSYWVAYERSICSLGTTRRTTFTIHCVFCFCILWVWRIDLIWGIVGIIVR